MNEEIDDAEFYHQDFTTASDWEVFIARLEEIVHQWNREDKKKDSKDITKGVWAIREEKVDFVDVGFIFSYHRNTLVESEENGEEKPTLIPNNFKFTVYDPKYESDHSVIYQWYGLNEFITLSPIENAGITSESHIKVLLSSIQIVVSNTNCSVPMLVQIQEKWQKSYLGVYVGDGVRTNFEMVHLQSGPYHCQTYKGLQNLFQDKIVSLQSPDHINGALQNTYQLSDFGNSVWKQELFDSDSDFNDVRSLLMLPFGVTIDPITTIFLKTTWTKLLVTSDNYNPFDALNWSTYVKMTSQPIVLLSDCINEVLSVLEYNSTVYDVLGDFVSSIDHEADNPLNLLTESKIPTITTVIKRATRNSLSKIRRGSAPLTEEVLVPILYYLFPDADEETTYAYSDKDSTTEFMRNLEQQCKGFKTCKVDSLPSRLAVVVGQALLTLGGVRAVAHIWFEFVQEMRFRWEKSVRVLGLSSGFPDPRTCFLHQKLQMLNCCIERKKAREERVVEPTSRPYEPEDSFSEDDEFFDCSTDKPVDDDTTRRKTKHSLWNRPVGRLGKFENLKLIKTGDPLYIPITQEPVPKTEDQLEEDTDVLLQLGSDAQGSELRAKMMSASLLSDMESFKAANPESILEDFIRWYSPRDWIEEDELDEWGQKKGHLSSRMLISDNTWVQMWKSAKPVPANRQKRLFDDTREAEKVLHYLDSCTLSQIVEMLLPVLSHAAIYRLSEEYVLVDDVLTDSHKSLQRVVKIVEKVSRDVKPSTRHYEALIQEIGALELLISQTNSLLYKLNPAGATDEALNSIVAKLVTGHEVEIPDRHKSNLGSRLVTMFSEAQKAFNLITNDPDSPDENVKRDKNFPQASKQEFVLKTLCASPAPYSVKCLQYLRTIISKGDFRLVGAFSEDMVFF